MIASRKAPGGRTPNEIVLNILLAGLTIVFLLAVVTLRPLAIFKRATSRLCAGFAARLSQFPRPLAAAVGQLCPGAPWKPPEI